jgi:hypothetical protein
MFKCFMCGKKLKPAEAYGSFNNITICYLCIKNDRAKIDAALQAALVKQAEDNLKELNDMEEE